MKRVIIYGLTSRYVAVQFHVARSNGSSDYYVVISYEMRSNLRAAQNQHAPFAPKIPRLCYGSILQNVFAVKPRNILWSSGRLIQYRCIVACWYLGKRAISDSYAVYDRNIDVVRYFQVLPVREAGTRR